MSSVEHLCVLAKFEAMKLKKTFGFLVYFASLEHKAILLDTACVTKDLPEYYVQHFIAGWLTKRGAYRKNWKKRWFVVFDTQDMRYHDNEQSAVPRGLIKLHEVLLMCPLDEQQYTYVLIVLIVCIV